MRYLIIYFFGLFIVSCGRIENKSAPIPDTDAITTSRIIQTNDTNFIVLISKENPKATELSADEVNEVNRIYFRCIADNKNSLRPSTEYKRQCFPVINDKGEKEVWVNCFCSAMDRDWKKEEIIVLDGGNCFFNFHINLKTKKYYDLTINGEA